MAVKIRLARWGAKKHPYYHIVAANSTSPRDGKFIKTLGKYDPLQETMDKKVINLDVEAIKHWLKVGAQPTPIVTKILAFAGLVEKKILPQLTKKHLPKTKAQERMKEQNAAIEAAKEAEKTAASKEGAVETPEPSVPEVVEENANAVGAVEPVATEEPAKEEA